MKSWAVAQIRGVLAGRRASGAKKRTRGQVYEFVGCALQEQSYGSQKREAKGLLYNLRKSRDLPGAPAPVREDARRRLRIGERHPPNPEGKQATSGSTLKDEMRVSVVPNTRLSL